jgi:hypothetical protein
MGLGVKILIAVVKEKTAKFLKNVGNNTASRNNNNFNNLDIVENKTIIFDCNHLDDNLNLNLVLIFCLLFMIYEICLQLVKSFVKKDSKESVCNFNCCKNCNLSNQ